LVEELPKPKIDSLINWGVLESAIKYTIKYTDGSDLSAYLNDIRSLMRSWSKDLREQGEKRIQKVLSDQGIFFSWQYGAWMTRDENGTLKEFGETIGREKRK